MHTYTIDDIVANVAILYDILAICMHILAYADSMDLDIANILTLHHASHFHCDHQDHHIFLLQHHHRPHQW